MGLLTLPLSEVFGPVWQGEGPHAGLRVGFVRLGLCNLSCSWCDTPYTWDRTRFDLAVECPPTPIETILARAREIDVDTFVLSGGEPLIHYQRLEPLLHPRWTWHAETNGTIAPPPWWRNRVAHTSVSPKVATDDPLARRIRLSVLEQWAELAWDGRACFKFVCSEPADLEEVAALVALVGIPPGAVWIMPEGTDAPTLLERHRGLVPGIMKHGWNTTTRLHVLLFGATRGV